jgi:acetamidase/formamidase
MVAAQVTVDLDPDRELAAPLVRTADAWVALGFDEDLDDALAASAASILELIEREYGLERREALALASVAVDFRVTQVVNAVKGVHAVLRDDAVHIESRP